MSAVVILNAVIEAQKDRYPDGLNDDEIFEFFCAETLLVNFGLDIEDIESGIIDGPQDGGIDAAYVFLDGNLIANDADIEALRSVRPNADLQLFLIQSKNQDSFKAAPVDKLSSALPILLDFKASKIKLDQQFNEEVIRICRLYVTAALKLATKHPNKQIRIFYCSKGNNASPEIQNNAKALAYRLTESTTCQTSFQLLGADELYKLSGIPQTMTIRLATGGKQLFGKKYYVTLCKLPDYLNCNYPAPF